MNHGHANGAALIGWQTLLADLSLILFMVTAASMSASPSGHARPAPARPPSSPIVAEPLALWRAGGSQSLARWLAIEQPDGRQQLTITAHYRKGTQVSALAAVQVLVSQAGAMGEGARIIIAPAAGVDGDEIIASLAYDRN